MSRSLRACNRSVGGLDYLILGVSQRAHQLRLTHHGQHERAFRTCSTLKQTASEEHSDAESRKDGERIGDHAQAPRTRAQSQLERKKRRIASGKWAPLKAARLAARIPKIPTPAPADANAPEDKKQVAGVLAEVERRRQAQEAKKHAAQARAAARAAAKAAPPKKPAAPPEPDPRPPKPAWALQKAALAARFPDGWVPRKRVSPDALAGVRALHASDPVAYSTPTLAAHFKISPEAIRRILRSKWTPNEQEAEDRRLRWERRGVRKWEEMAAKGIGAAKNKLAQVRNAAKRAERGDDGGVVERKPRRSGRQTTIPTEFGEVAESFADRIL